MKTCLKLSSGRNAFRRHFRAPFNIDETTVMLNIVTELQVRSRGRMNAWEMTGRRQVKRTSDLSFFQIQRLWVCPARLQWWPALQECLGAPRSNAGVPADDTINGTSVFVLALDNPESCASTQHTKHTDDFTAQHLFIHYFPFSHSWYFHTWHTYTLNHGA